MLSSPDRETVPSGDGSVEQHTGTTELSGVEARRLAQAAEATARIKDGDHFRDWTYVGQGLATLRDIAMRDAHTNAPYGKRYTAAYARRLKEVPALATFDNATKAH